MIQFSTAFVDGKNGFPSFWGARCRPAAVPGLQPAGCQPNLAILSFFGPDLALKIDQTATTQPSYLYR
jgi:hypothetical protein